VVHPPTPVPSAERNGCATYSLWSVAFRVPWQFHGAAAIPADWLAKLATRDFMEQMAYDLIALSDEKDGKFLPLKP
jgi:hypothetical protein